MGSSAETEPPVHHDDVGEAEQEDEVDWWHRDHPVFVPLVSFYAGLLGILLLPAVYVAVLRSVMEFEQAERWFWLGALILLVPLAMLLSARTRRAGWFVLLGMVAAVVVFGGTGALVLWALMR